VSDAGTPVKSLSLQKHPSSKLHQTLPEHTETYGIADGMTLSSLKLFFFKGRLPFDALDRLVTPAVGRCVPPPSDIQL
jgi:hypothetical protein